MKQKTIVLALFALALLIGVNLTVPQRAEAGIFSSGGEVTYKEYWVDHSQFTAGCNPDGSTMDPDGSWYLEPGPLNKCPKTVSFTLPDNFDNAIKIEMFLDLWRNYDSQSARFIINNNTGKTYAPPVGSDWSRTPYVVEIPKNELFQGPNTIKFWGDRPYHVHDISIRVYYDDANPLVGAGANDVTPPSGQIVSIVDDSGTPVLPGDGGILKVNTDKLVINATAGDGAKYVEFHAYYDGYDEDNDGDFTDWHNSSRNNWWPGGNVQGGPPPNGGTNNHIGTKSVPGNGQVSITWDMPHIVNQSGVRFKIRVVDSAGNVREAAGGVSEEFTLARNYSVFYYTIPGFTDFGLHMDGSRPDTATYKFDLPNTLDLTQIDTAWIVGAYWKKPKFSINGSSNQPVSSGTEEWELGRRTFNENALKNGENTIVYSYNGSGSGHFVEEPGPMFVLRRFNGPNDVVPPYISSRSPGPNSTNVDTRQPVVIHMGEAASGVDPKSIVMTVNGDQVTPVISGNSIDMILTYTPPQNQPYPNDTSIPVTVFGCDLIGPNCMTGADLFSFRTEDVDETPPNITNVSVTTTDSTAAISWKTNELADSIIDYGETPSYEIDTIVDPAYVSDHSILISSLTPDTVYNYKITSEDQDGNPASTTNLTFKTKKLPGAVQSDDFSSCTLNDEIWTYIDPVGDATFTKDGQALQIGVPGGVSHDIWKSGINAPRVMQFVANQDFQIVVKMDSNLNAKTQLQGILVQQDANNYLRFNVQHDGADASLAVVDGNNGNAILTFGLPLLSTPPYLRVTRLANLWTLDYSVDGTNWANATSFNKLLTISQVGLFAGNTGGNPAHTGIFDYFFNTAAPISPEDPPRTLTINVDGVGTAAKSPDKASYNCQELVNLAATPAQDWTFVGWSGDLTSVNPVETYQVAKSSIITATFENNLTYTLSVDTAYVGGIDGGTVDVDPVKTEYKYNDQVSLTATPTLGWSFTGWTGDLDQRQSE